MKLTRIEINNYRSIQSLEIEIKPINESFTYTLLGINESGKSSILKAISLFDDDKINYPLDFFDTKEKVSVVFSYILEDSDIVNMNEKLIKEFSFDKDLLKKIEITEIEIVIEFENNSEAKKTTYEDVIFKEEVFPSYTLKERKVSRKLKMANEENKDEALDLSAFFNEFLPTYFWSVGHFTTFWKSSSEYLISDEIDLIEFSNDPKKISVPLKNCFDLADIINIKEQIDLLKTSAVAIQNLEEILSDKTTKHIKRIWPEHPIKIKFKINNLKLSFLVEDEGVKFNNKLTSQRSDGFRQLISFLLTLSAEHKTDALSNSILILDEPETHLHPTAQINLRDELINISKNNNNNIVFFATHSNYMIDKENMDRCLIIKKRKDGKTTIENISIHKTSYAEVNYLVFNILSNDYHNELYGYAEDLILSKLNGLPKEKKWYNAKYDKEESVSLQTYIRHSIHHPENKRNTLPTEKELKKSIETLRKILERT